MDINHKCLRCGVRVEPGKMYQHRGGYRPRSGLSLKYPLGRTGVVIYNIEPLYMYSHYKMPGGSALKKWG
jgi:hypothetical protein